MIWFMKLIYNISIWILAFFVLSSCTTTVYLPRQNDYNAQYVGKNERSIILAWGAPSRVASDGADGKILVYEEVSFTSSSSGGTIVSSELTGPIITSNASSSTSATTAYAHFYLNKQGICYNVKTNHVKEGREFSLGRTIALCAPLTGALILLCIVGSL